MCQVDLTHLTWNGECSKVGDLILSVGESLSSFPSLKFDICFTSLRPRCLEDHEALSRQLIYMGLVRQLRGLGVLLVPRIHLPDRIFLQMGEMSNCP